MLFARSTTEWRVFRGALFIVVLSVARTSWAQVDFTQDELRSLPRVCLAQAQINDQLHFPVVPEQERRQWARQLGEDDYASYHHYCWAILYIRRANTANTAVAKTHAYSVAVDNFEYVLRNASTRFALLPEVYLQKGLTLRMLGEDGEAARDFMVAIKLKRDYTPAYAALVDLHLDLGSRDAAEAVLKEGLSHAPNSKILAQKKVQVEAQSPR